MNERKMDSEPQAILWPTMLADDGEVPLVEGVAPDEIILGGGYFEQTIALGGSMERRGMGYSSRNFPSETVRCLQCCTRVGEMYFGCKL